MRPTPFEREMERRRRAFTTEMMQLARLRAKRSAQWALWTADREYKRQLLRDRMRQMQELQLQQLKGRQELEQIELAGRLDIEEARTREGLEWEGREKLARLQEELRRQREEEEEKRRAEEWKSLREVFPSLPEKPVPEGLGTLFTELWRRRTKLTDAEQEAQEVRAIVEKLPEEWKSLAANADSYEELFGILGRGYAQGIIREQKRAEEAAAVQPPPLEAEIFKSLKPTTVIGYGPAGTRKTVEGATAEEIAEYVRKEAEKRRKAMQLLGLSPEALQTGERQATELPAEESELQGRFTPEQLQAIEELKRRAREGDVVARQGLERAGIPWQ